VRMGHSLREDLWQYALAEEGLIHTHKYGCEGDAQEGASQVADDARAAGAQRQSRCGQGWARGEQQALNPCG